MFYNKLACLLIINIFTFLSFINLQASQQKIIENTSLFNDNLQDKFYQSKLIVKKFAKDNAAVINQYDLFTKHLEDVFRSGKGLIDKDIHRIMDAVIFSAERHQFQIRKDPNQTPYIIHTIGVADLLLTIGKIRDADIIIAGLLHDTVEDTATSFEEIKEQFGIRVENFVREVTDDKSLPKKTRKELQIKNASHKSAGAAQIKLADKLYNLTDLLNYPPHDWTQERIDEYFQWAHQVVNQLPWVNAELKKSVDAIIDQYKERS